MSKETRAEKRAREAQILAEMDEAMAAQNAEAGATETTATESESPTQGQKKWYRDNTPTEVHCKHCRTLMENGVCPNCGFHIYVPMDKAKRDKIRWIVGGVCIAAFLVVFLCLKLAS